MGNFFKNVGKKLGIVKEDDTNVYITKNPSPNLDNAEYSAPVSIWSYQDSPGSSSSSNPKKTVSSSYSSNYSYSYYNKRELKVEKHINVTIVFCDLNLSEDKLKKYLNLFFSNNVGYFVLVRADGTFSECFSNSYSSKEKNIKYSIEFLNCSASINEGLSLHDAFLMLEGVESRIKVPNMITLQEAKEEQSVYEKSFEERRQKVKEEIKKIEEEEKREKEEEKKVEAERLKNEIYNTPDVLLSNEISSKTQSPNSFEKLYQDKTASCQKRRTYKKYKPRPTMPIWNFIPSKPIYEVSVNLISFVGVFDDIPLSTEYLPILKETRRRINPFIKKKTELVFYSITDKNIETLALLGFKKIELLHEKFA